MKSLRKHGGNRKTGFSLIELLTVIVIIGVLAGMISTAVMLAKKKSLEVARDVELKAIKSAIEAYKFEYQEWPKPESKFEYENDNHKVIDWMMSSEPGKNERGIKFLNLGDYRQDAGNMVDYAGNKYKIKFHFTNDTVTVE